MARYTQSESTDLGKRVIIRSGDGERLHVRNSMGQGRVKLKVLADGAEDGVEIDVSADWLLRAIVFVKEA